jgi:hypothetical protein
MGPRRDADGKAFTTKPPLVALGKNGLEARVAVDATAQRQ